jgi:hypothetical protein
MLKICTDQDKAMEGAIAKEFPGVRHRICRWHVVNKVMPNLNVLFKEHANRDFKERFNSVLNHPLTPGEFETAWNELVAEFGLHDDGTMQSLYQQRQDFIPAYFKNEYCGRMASTQRSECTNFLIKKGFVNKRTCLHRFAKQMMNFMHTRMIKHSTETYLASVSIPLANSEHCEIIGAFDRRNKSILL